MIKKIIFFLFFPYIAYADDLKISNINMRSPAGDNYPASIYLNIDNQSDKLYYLLGIEILDHPNTQAKISKTVIEKTIARVITIDRLVIPSKMQVKLSPLGIFIMVKNLPKINSPKPLELKIKFIFNDNIVLIKSVSLN